MATIRALSRCGLRTRPVLRTIPLASQHMNQSLHRHMSAETAPVESNIGGRFALTFEVIVSKIFPAGFCWQASSLVAEGSLGLTADSVGFALVTGFGDACGVMAGHCIYKMIQGKDMGVESQIGAWLATSAFLSGTGWQPIVNVCAGMGLGFNSAALVTTGGCAALFFTGLRLGRRIYSVGTADSSNFAKDAQLGISIGGATGAFVGTDVSFAGNWLRPVVGVEEATSDLVGMVKAGSSTALGFGAFQSVQNVSFPAGSNWTD